MSSPPSSSRPRKKPRLDDGSKESTSYNTTDLSDDMSPVSEPYSMSLDKDNPPGLAALSPKPTHPDPSPDEEHEIDLDRTPRAQHFDLPVLDEVTERDEPVSGASLSLAEVEPDSPIRPEPVARIHHQTAEDRPITEDPGIKLFKDLPDQPNRIAEWLRALGIKSTVTIQGPSATGTVIQRAKVTMVTTLSNGKTKSACKVTKNDLKGYWKFRKTQPLSSASRQLVPRSSEWGQAPCRNIVTPPEKEHPNGTKGQKKPRLDGKIELAIRFEKKELEKAVLYLPNDWKDSGEGVRPSFLRVPDPYYDYLFQNTAESDNESEASSALQSGGEAGSQRERGTMYEDDDQGSDSETETEKVSDGDNDRTTTNQGTLEATCDLFSQISQDAEFDEAARLEQGIQDHEKDFVDEKMNWQPSTRNSTILRNLSNEERMELERLQEKYPFPNKSATEKQKREIAIAFRAALDERNMPFFEWKLNKQLVDRFCLAAEVDGCIEWIDRESIKEKIRSSGVGDPFINEDLRYRENCSRRVIDVFASQLGGLKISSEGEVEKSSGFYLKGFVTGDGLATSHNKALKFPSHLRMFGSNPSPDVYSRVAELQGWASKLLPVLFAGECKQGDKHTENTKAQLACAFHATLVILVLYYLDNRRSSTEPLPHWLYLDAVDYVENGFLIYAHYPRYIYEPEPHWEFVSTIITKKYQEVFQDSMVEYSVQATAALLRLVTHTYFVLHQLRQWKRAATVLKPLAEQAAWEEKRGI